MVVACLNEEKGTYLIVGFTGAPEFGDVRKKYVASVALRSCLLPLT
jgi:hypothetical protein